MARTAKQKCCMVGLPIWCLLSVLVIFMPEVFYTNVEEIPKSKRTDRQNALVALQQRYREGGFDQDLLAVNKDIERSKTELKNLNSRKSMFRKTAPQLQTAIIMQQRRVEELFSAQKALMLERDTALTQMRALTPVFSKMAFDETRELFKKRQEEYAGIFCWFWKWDMMWSMMFTMPMGGRDGGLGEAIMRAVLDLMYKLTVGTVFAFTDFAARLPFWLKEYQIFTYEDIADQYPLNTEKHTDRYVSDSKNGNTNPNEDEEIDAYERLRREHEATHEEEYNNEFELENDNDIDVQQQSLQTTTRKSRGKKYEGFETVGVVGSSGGWMSTFYSIVFWAMAVCAASGATVGIILAIWSPVILMFIYAVYKNRGRVDFGANYPQYRQRRNDHYD